MMTDLNVAVIAAIIAAFAAISSAVISALIGLSNSKRSASQKLAEMRQVWIEDLRNHMADFVGVVHRILNESSSAKAKETKTERLEQLNADLMRLESYISMKLNQEETPHARLAGVVGQTRGASAHYSHTPTISFMERIQRHLHEIDELSRFVFKVEWNKASDEIKPVSRRRRKERERSLEIRYAKIQDTVTPYLNPIFQNPME